MRRTIMLTILLSLETMAAAAPQSGLPMAKPKSVGMSTERLETVETVMKRYIDDDHVPGTVTLVASHGKVVHFRAQACATSRTANP